MPTIFTRNREGERQFRQPRLDDLLYLVQGGEHCDAVSNVVMSIKT
jgi:hypothetical protein